MTRVSSQSRAGPIAEFLEPLHDLDETAPEARAATWAELAERAARRLLDREEQIVGSIQSAHGFSDTEARRAIRCALKPLSKDGLLAAWRAEIGARLDRGDAPRFPARTLVVGGGVIPQPNVLALVAAAMVSRCVLFRPSSGDPVLPTLLIDTMNELRGQTMGGRSPLNWATWPREEEAVTGELLRAADALVAFGEESTLENLTRDLRAGADRFLYGPRISFAVFDPSALAEAEEVHRWMDRLADDVAAYDQRGCLSPTTLYLLGVGSESIERPASRLAHALRRRALVHGFAGRMTASAASAIHSLRSIYAMDPELGRSVEMSAGLPGWTVLMDRSDARLRPTPGYQTVHVVGLEGWEELTGAVRPMAGRLQAMGLGPEGASCPAHVEREMRAMGLSRICPLGEMQSPPLNWTHDGNPIFPVLSSADA